MNSKIKPLAGATVRLRDLLLLAVASGILFFSGLGSHDLWNPNEPIYGQAVVEMAERGDWIVPTVNERVFAEKPILYYWLALTAAKVTGTVDEWSLRLPAALAGVGSVILTYLLILPYTSRRRALLAAALLATQYQVFWVSRSVQMDVFVLLTTLGALVPLTRMLDFELRPSVAWLLAGLSIGFGFAAKGPVTVILPGLVIATYAIICGHLRRLIGWPMLIGALAAMSVAAPWYGLLWLRGDTTILVEVLFRQNFTRFVDAWDHQQPWWYYLKYLLIDYAPWSWFLPVLFLDRARDQGRSEAKLRALCWGWIGAIVFFFSLSTSKRAPYIIPIAPAIAGLVSSLVDRWIFEREFVKQPVRRAGVVVFSLVGLVMVAGGAAGYAERTQAPSELQIWVLGLVAFLLVAGGLLLATLRFSPRFAPPILLGTLAVFFLATGTCILPRADSLKSTRSFAAAMKAAVDETGGDLASAGLWQWRADYVYYYGQTIPNLVDAAAVEAFWQRSANPMLLLEHRAGRERVIEPPSGAEVLLEGSIGGRTATLLYRPPSDPCAPGDVAGEEPAGWHLDALRSQALTSKDQLVFEDRSPAELPSALAGKGAITQARRVAYEVEYSEDSQHETELFLGEDGQMLFMIAKLEGSDQDEAVVREELSPVVRRSLDHLLGGIPICRLQREREWGQRVIAAKWLGPEGPQELKLLEDDGSLLFLELPTSEPIPDVVLEGRASAVIEAMVLDVFDRGGSVVPRYFLANGWPITFPADR